MSAHHCRRARRSRRGSDHSCRTAISFRSRGFNEVRARSTVVRRKTRVVRGMTVFGSVAARTPWYGNGTGLRTGASSEVNGGAAHESPHPSDHRVRPGRMAAPTARHISGSPAVHGNWIYVTPGVDVQIGNGMNIKAEVKLPVHRALANRQLDSTGVLQFGISRSFRETAA